MAFDAKKNLVPGLNLLVILRNKPYQAVVTGEKQSDVFFIRLARPDQTALSVMVNSMCTLQCITDDGLAFKFQCKVISAKIPVIGLSHPESEVEGINVRKRDRVPVSYWTALLGVVKENGKPTLKTIGEGTIVDLNDGGCMVMTNNKFVINDPIYLSFEYQDGKNPLRLKGKIRQVRPAPYGLSYYRTQFEDIKPEYKETIIGILENPEL